MPENEKLTPAETKLKAAHDARAAFLKKIKDDGDVMDSEEREEYDRLNAAIGDAEGELRVEAGQEAEHAQAQEEITEAMYARLTELCTEAGYGNLAKVQIADAIDGALTRDKRLRPADKEAAVKFAEGAFEELKKDGKLPKTKQELADEAQKASPPEAEGGAPPQAENPEQEDDDAVKVEQTVLTGLGDGSVMLRGDEDTVNRIIDGAFVTSGEDNPAAAKQSRANKGEGE